MDSCSNEIAGNRARKGRRRAAGRARKIRKEKKGIKQIHMRYRNRKDRANALFEFVRPGVEL